MKKNNKQKKRIKKLRSTLEWMEVESLDHAGIYLKSANEKMISRGLRILPINIYLLTDAERRAIIYRLASAFDKLYQYKLYFKFIKNEPETTYQNSYYIKMLESEENPSVSKIIELQIDKLEWFRNRHREVKFYVLVQDDELHIDKAYEALKREFTYAFGSQELIKEMTYTDYKSVIQQEFENEYIDELLFTQAILPDSNPNEIDIINKKIEECNNENIKQ